MDKTDRIKYFGENDMSIWHFLEKAEPIINSFNPSKEYTDINEVIELYNVQELMDSGTVLRRWDDETVERLKKASGQFSAIIGRFFSGITSSNFIYSFRSLNPLYLEDFWSLVEKYKVYERVDGKVFSEMLSDENTALWPILEHAKIVTHYDSELADYMRSSGQSAELLLDSFLTNNKKKRFFPKSLFPTEYDLIFHKYIDSDHPSLNYLKLISNSQNSAECPISDKLKKKARERYNTEANIRFKHSPGIEYGVGIGFGDIDTYKEVDITNPLMPRYVYDTKWIAENLDYPTLLNNFRYVFDQVDMCWRSNLVSLKYHMGILEKSLGIKGKKEYQTGMQYEISKMTALGQIQGYRNFLNENGIDIEKVFQWFFCEYLENEFNASGFNFTASSTGTSYVERIRNIASEMDGVLKQFRSFLEDGYIDRELLEMSSGHIVISQLGSFFCDKYAYSNSEETNYEMYLLFSDQSRLTYTEKTGTKYRAFFDMLASESMSLADFAAFQIESIEWLISRNVLYIDDQQHLSLAVEKCVILKDLYIHEVICPHYYISFRQTLDDMISSGDLRYESTLFSKPEQDYLNYMLNKSEYDNGLDLRNKYLHGTNSLDEETQERDYNYLLLIVVLIIMKINEEFCLKLPIKR